MPSWPNEQMTNRPIGKNDCLSKRPFGKWPVVRMTGWWDIQYTKWHFDRTKWQFDRAKWQFDRIKWQFDRTKWQFDRIKWLVDKMTYWWDIELTNDPFLECPADKMSCLQNDQLE